MLPRECYKATCKITCNSACPHNLTVAYKDSAEEAVVALEERIAAYKRTERSVEVGEIIVTKMR